MTFSAGRAGHEERERLEEDLVCGYLRGSCRASNVPPEEIPRPIRNSHAFGLHDARDQVGFASAVTDYARFAYLAEVFVLEGHRGRDLGRRLARCILEHPNLRGVHRWMLAIRGSEDAPGLYRPFGLAPRTSPRASCNGVIGVRRKEKHDTEGIPQPERRN